MGQELSSAIDHCIMPFVGSGLLSYVPRMLRKQTALVVRVVQTSACSESPNPAFDTCGIEAAESGHRQRSEAVTNVDMSGAKGSEACGGVRRLTAPTCASRQKGLWGSSQECGTHIGRRSAFR